MGRAALLIALFAAGLAAGVWLDRRRARAALRQQQELAHERFQSRLQVVFNGMIEGVLLLDAGGRVRMINASLRTLFEITTDVRGRTIMEAFRWHQLAALAARLPVEKNIAGAELEFNRATRRIITVNASTVEGDDGPGQLFVFREVTRIKELESIRKEFVGNVSHELRTPLSLIKGFAETLLDGAKDDPVQCSRFLQKIDNHADRLLFLIEDLLAISRLESGHGALNPQTLDLHQTTQRVLDDLADTAAGRKVKLQNQIPAGATAWADGDRLQQVLLNLVENAVKYGREGGRVTVGLGDGAPGATGVYVEDDGPGVPPESIPRLFERFYRVDRARSRESGGTGLGLAIVKHIVQAHGGEVRVRSEPGAGTRFDFSLPHQPPGVAHS